MSRTLDFLPWDLLILFFSLVIVDLILFLELGYLLKFLEVSVFFLLLDPNDVPFKDRSDVFRIYLL